MRQLAGGELQPFLHEPLVEGLIQCGDAVVVEACGDRSEHRHGVGRLHEQLAIALILLAHVAQRVSRALAVEFVDRDKVGEVEHVDLFELARRPELGRHHVERDVDQWHDCRIPLADAGGLDDDQVEAGDLARRDGVRQRLGDLTARLPGGHRAHVDVRVVDRVHPDAIAEQRAARLASRRIDRNDGDAQLVVLVQSEAPYEFIGK